jgi:hypothetical protein
MFDNCTSTAYALREQHALVREEGRTMAKATPTIRQALHYPLQYAAYFAARQVLCKRVVAFSFDCIQAHDGLLALKNTEALTTLEKLTHATDASPHSPMPLTALTPDIPAMSRHGAINAARSFFSSLKNWRARKEKHEATHKRKDRYRPFRQRPLVPPRSWKKCVPCYASLWRQGLSTARVNPRNTSRACHRCHSLVVRSNQRQPQAGYTPGAVLCSCPQCQMRDHTGRNASPRVGQRLSERTQEPLKEKPHAHSRRVKREPKGSGVGISQDARCQRRPSPDTARRGDQTNGHGSAQGNRRRMGVPLPDIASQ